VALERYSDLNSLFDRLETLEAYCRIEQTKLGKKTPTQFDVLEKKIVDDRVELKEGIADFNGQIKTVNEFMAKLTIDMAN